MFYHLSAARELIDLLRQGKNNASLPFETPEANQLFALIMEIYYYLVLVNLIGPADDKRANATRLSANTLSFDALEKMDAFGTIFNGSQELINMVSEISALWTPATSLGHGDEIGKPSNMIARADTYATLRSRIMHWQHPWSIANPGVTGKMYEPEQHAAIETWRHGLAVYLEAAYADAKPLGPSSRFLIAEHVREATKLIMDTDLLESQHGSTLGWPMVILGSCLEDHSRCQVVVKRIADTRLRSWNLICALAVLRLLWKDMEEDETAFGPYGLYLTMHKSGLMYSVG
jgi:hypothetical protein